MKIIEGMDGDREPIEEHSSIAHERRAYIASLAERAREWVGSTAAVGVTEFDGGASLSVVPGRSDSASAWVVAMSYLDVQIGDSNCRFSLAHADASLIDGILRAVIAGHVTETRAWARCAVAVTLEDGRVLVERGAENWWALVPLPGWVGWGRRTQFAPYDIAEARR